MLSTGEGQTVDPWTDPAGDPSPVLSPRPIRNAANDAARTWGVCGAAENAGDGDTDMRGTLPI